MKIRKLHKARMNHNYKSKMAKRIMSMAKRNDCRVAYSAGWWGTCSADYDKLFSSVFNA